MLDEDKYPNWIGCVALKELRQGLRRGIFTIPFSIVHIIVIIALFIDVTTNRAIPYFDSSALLNPLMFIPVPFNQFSCGMLWAVIPITCIFIIPFVGITMMSQELNNGNNELLILTGLKRDQVVIEKFLTAWALCLLMLISLIPYTLVPYWINGMRIMVVMELISSVALYSAAMCALVIAASGYTRIHFRILFFILFATVCLNCLSLCFMKHKLHDGLIWHYLNALIATTAIVIFGLASAKSQLKLTLFYYETKPTVIICVLLFFTPLLAGLLGLFTFGYLPAIGYLCIAILTWLLDTPTREKKQLAQKKLNLPHGAELLN